MTDENAQNQPEAPLPTSPEALMEKLTGLGIAYELHRHQPVFTVEEAKALEQDIPGVHIKNLFLRDKKENMCMVVVPHDFALDLKALAPAIGLDRISFGSPERLFQYLGVRPGSVNPFAAMNDTTNAVSVVLHAEVASASVVSAHPMLNSMSLALSGPDIVRFLDSVGHPPKILDLGAFCRAAA